MNRCICIPAVGPDFGGMPLVPTREGLYLLPSWLNVVIAVATLLGFAALVASPVLGSSEAWMLLETSATKVIFNNSVVLLALLDHALAYAAVDPIIYYFLRANFTHPSGIGVSEYLVRTTSALAIVGCIVVIVAQTFGRTTLIAWHGIRLLAVVQAGSWGATLVAHLQADGATPFMPSAAQCLLGATPLEIIAHAKASLNTYRPPTKVPSSLAELIATARALAPLLLLPDEHREDALALLPPAVADALETPLAQQLPRAAQAMLEPWEGSDALHLRRGLPRGLRLQRDAGVAAPTAMLTPEYPPPPPPAPATGNGRDVPDILAHGRAGGAAQGSDDTAGDHEVAEATAFASAHEGGGAAQPHAHAARTPTQREAFHEPSAAHSHSHRARTPPHAGPKSMSRARTPPSGGGGGGGARAGAPELLIAKLASRAIGRYAWRQVEVTRGQVLALAGALTSRAIGAALFGPRLALSVAGQVLSTGWHAGGAAVSVGAAVLSKVRRTEGKAHRA